MFSTSETKATIKEGIMNCLAVRLGYHTQVLLDFSNVDPVANTPILLNLNPQRLAKGGFQPAFLQVGSALHNAR